MWWFGVDKSIPLIAVAGSEGRHSSSATPPGAARRGVGLTFTAASTSPRQSPAARHSTPSRISIHSKLQPLSLAPTQYATNYTLVSRVGWNTFPATPFGVDTSIRLLRTCLLAKDRYVNYTRLSTAIMSASSDVVSKLQQLEKAPPSPQRAEAFNGTLNDIINAFSGNELAVNLVAYVTSILSEDIGVIASRPLLSTFVEQYRNIQDNEVKIEAGSQIVDVLEPKIVSFEQQDTDLKFCLADAYEAEEDFNKSASILRRIKLDSSQRAVSDDDKAQVWIRICRCYLEEDNSTDAMTFLNRLKTIIYNVTDQVVKLQFQLSQARISDSVNNFLDASSAYYTLSTERLIDEEERMHTLSAAITCAVLGPAGPTRARQLGKLYKDDRAADTAEFSILEKIFLDRLLEPTEVAAFAAGLKDHQLAKTSDGSTVLDKAVLEHNLLAASRLYQNISISALGSLLGTDADRAEAYAAGMIESDRLSGSIDQIEGIIHFHTKEGGKESSTMDLRAWDANIQGLAEEVEKVTTMLQREDAGWYEAYVAA